MELKIKKSELAKRLSLAQSIVERKTTMPILANVLLEADKNCVNLCATDLEVSLSCPLDAEIIKPGKVTVNARALYDIVKELPEDKIHIQVQDNHWLKISCGRSEFELVGLSAEDFPALPKKQSGNSYRFPASSLMEMIEKTAFAMSTDEARYNLNGILLEQEGKGVKAKLRMVATDGHRLSITDRDVKGEWKLDKPVIIPRKGVTELKKLLENQEDEFEFWVGEKHIIAYGKNTTLSMRLIDGQFPPYRQVLPKDGSRVVSLERKILAQALKRVNAMASERSRGVCFNISPKHLEISSNNPDFGKAREELTVKYSGASFEIGFNGRYFLDARAVIQDEEAVLQLGDDTAPCMLRSEFDPGFTHVIMPMRL